MFTSINTNLIKDGNTSANNPEDISNLFNIFFTSLSSNSPESLTECHQFNENLFNNLINNNKIKPSSFNFKQTDNITVENLLTNLSGTSGPGMSGISTKIVKAASCILFPIITSLFNECIAYKKIPTEWKAAVVSPIYKGKGSNEDINNYRGISVNPPIAKLFEKILATQIITYLNENNILFAGQHSFRNSHSCESALNEILSDMNEIRSKRLIGILLFIDFRKAFDLVDSRILLIKLKHLGFGDDAIDLIKNYFAERTQIVKYENTKSSILPINLSVPQGSVLGPLFFLLFINDLPFFLKSVTCKMFADDTTIYKSMNDLLELISFFRLVIKDLITWCNFNRFDINWSKTFIIFITNKSVEIPKEIIFDEKTIQLNV